MCSVVLCYCCDSDVLGCDITNVSLFSLTRKMISVSGYGTRVIVIVENVTSVA